MTDEKLVRDRIPAIIKESGGSPRYRKVIDDELDLFLRRKIVEESNELLESGDIEELIDIFEVLERFIVHRGVDRGFLEDKKQTKKLARGGFEEGFVLKMD